MNKEKDFTVIVGFVVLLIIGLTNSEILGVKKVEA